MFLRLAAAFNLINDDELPVSVPLSLSDNGTALRCLRANICWAQEREIWTHTSRSNMSHMISSTIHKGRLIGRQSCFYGSGTQSQNGLLIVYTRVNIVDN
jgi:hypothetical protein